MGHDRDRALAALRLSLGRWTTRREVKDAAQQITDRAQTLLARRGENA